MASTVLSKAPCTREGCVGARLPPRQSARREHRGDERHFWSGIWVASIDDPGAARPLIPQDEIVLGVAASPDGTRLIYVRPANAPPPELGPLDPGAVNMVDLGTGAVENVLNRTANAAWLDNDTLIVTEITPD